jgi:hypothetical protein
MKAGSAVDVDAEHNPEVSRKASNAGLRREEQVHGIAAAGVQGSGSKLPHHDKIQAAFGKHDISHIQAHTGAQAEGASRAMGAEAYATGNQVAFAGTPDLHTAAHEAAHVVQQQQGVQLKGGVGASGDSYEQNADAVADRVVQGKSAEDLLGAPSAAKSEGSAVQRKGHKEADKPVDKDKAHGAASTMSNGGVQASLKYLAFEFNAWIPKLRDWMAPGPTTEAGAEPQIQAIEGIYDQALTDVMRVSELIGTMNKDERRYFGADVRQVQGMAYRFLPIMNQAANWIRNQFGHEHDKLLDIRQIQQFVDGLTDRLGVEKGEMDRTTPEGDEKSLLIEASVGELDALEASVVSLEAGNTEDASRVTMHARYLHNFTKDHGVQFSSKGKHKLVVELHNKLKKIHKEKPELNLGEAVNHVAALTQTR